MIKKTAELVEEKKIEGIYDIRDESDRNGMRIVYELKRDAIPNVVLNKLFKYTSLQSSFSVSNIALVNGRPLTLNLKDMIVHYVAHRHEVVVRRTKFDLRKAEERAHILEGLIIASDNIDEVIAIIRAAASPDEAREKLMERFTLSDLQTKAIVEMRLRQLTGLEQDKLRGEYEELQVLIGRLKALLENEPLRMQVIKEEMIAIKAKYGDERRSIIEYSAEDFKMEDMISDDEVVITISHMGYIKRTKLTEYRQQSRGGVGSRGSATRDEDFLEHLFMATNHNYLLIFTEKGKCFWIRVFEIPEGAKTTKGRAIQNLINIEQDDKVRAYINVNDLSNTEYINNNFIILCTKNGVIKKTSLEAYSRPRQNGINAITVREGDQLLEAALTNGTNEVMLASKFGKVCRFNESRVRPMGRNASGVRGIELDIEANKGNEVIGMICLNNKEATVLVVSEKGYGKRSDIEEYRITNRGGKGVKTINVTEKTGILVAIKQVTDANDLMIITKSGITIRLDAEKLRVMGRATQGVRLINLKGNEEIAAVAVVNKDEDEEPVNTDLIEGLNLEAPEAAVNPDEISKDLNEDKPADDNEENTGTEIENDDVE